MEERGKEKEDALIENFTNRLWQRFQGRMPGREGRRGFQTRATTPQLFASNEASRDIFQSVQPSRFWVKGRFRRFRDRRRRREKGERNRERERERENERERVEIVIHAPISGISCQGTITCCEMTRNATLLREKRMLASGKSLSLSLYPGWYFNAGYFLSWISSLVSSLYKLKHIFIGRS